MGQPMVFFDIDGTLYDYDKRLPDSAKRSVLKLKEKGIPVAIATGRGPFMFEELRKELGIDMFVSFNGQYVEAGGEVIFHAPLSVDELASLEKEADKRDHPLVFMQRDRMIANRKHHPVVEQCIATLKVDLPSYEPNGYHDVNTYQTLIFCTAEEEGFYHENFPNFHYIRWDDHSVDVLNAGISKAVGIRKLVEHLNVRMEDVYAFGDALNDIEMMQEAGKGIAMGNADEEVKRAADWVTKAVDEDGIEYGLKYVGLI